MGLFTDPVTLDTDHVFSYNGQDTTDKKSTVGVYIEPAAAIADESKLVVKHDNSGSVPRHLLQRTIKKVPAASADGELKRVTVNVTIVADELFTDTEVSNETDIIFDAVAQAGVIKSLLQNRL